MCRVHPRERVYMCQSLTLCLSLCHATGQTMPPLRSRVRSDASDGSVGSFGSSLGSLRYVAIHSHSFSFNDDRVVCGGREDWGDLDELRQDTL